MDGNVTENDMINQLNGKAVAIPRIDPTFTKEGYAADAKATGEALEEIRRQIEELASLMK